MGCAEGAYRVPQRVSHDVLRLRGATSTPRQDAHANQLNTHRCAQLVSHALAMCGQSALSPHQPSSPLVTLSYRLHGAEFCGGRGEAHAP